MTSESQDSMDNTEQVSKEEHIKQRLKEMGVSEDSERPKKSFFAKFGKFMLPAVVVVLVIAYWVEYSKQENLESDTPVAAENVDASTQQSGSYFYTQPIQRPEPPEWVKEHRTQMQQQIEPPEWVKQRQAQMMQRPEPPAWVQERKESWLKQQQAMNNQFYNNAGRPAQNGAYPAYPPQAYWQPGPGYYPYNGYAPWPAYPPPYANGYPYYNGWK